MLVITAAVALPGYVRGRILSVDTDRPAPGQLIRLTTIGLDASLPTAVRFSMPSGLHVEVPAFVEGWHTIAVSVPPIFDISAGEFRDGTVMLAIVQAGPDGKHVSADYRGLVVGPLPEISGPPGAVTVAALELLIQLAPVAGVALDQANASLGAPAGTPELTSAIDLAKRLAALTDAIRIQAAAGRYPAVLGSIGPDQVALDRTQLLVLDQFMAAWLLSLGPHSPSPCPATDQPGAGLASLRTFDAAEYQQKVFAMRAGVFTCTSSGALEFVKRTSGFALATLAMVAAFAPGVAAAAGPAVVGVTVAMGLTAAVAVLGMTDKAIAVRGSATAEDARKALEAIKTFDDALAAPLKKGWSQLPTLSPTEELIRALKQFDLVEPALTVLTDIRSLQAAFTSDAAIRPTADSASVPAAPAPVWPSVGAPKAQVGKPYTFPAGHGASGGMPPYSYSVSSGSLPSGLTLDLNTGTVSGTPTQKSTSETKVCIHDRLDSETCQTLAWVVDPPPLVFNPVNPPDGRVGETYTSFSFCQPAPRSTGILCDSLGLGQNPVNPNGGQEPYTFSLGKGFLPSGLALNLNGILSGSPRASGTSQFEVCAKDSAGTVECRQVTLSVAPEPSRQPLAAAPPISVQQPVPPALPPVAAGPEDTTPITLAITSKVCTPDLRFGYNGYWSVTLSGTASGPITSTGVIAELYGVYGATLQVLIVGRWGIDNVPIKCGAWHAGVASTCTRKPGDPPTTTWSWSSPGSTNQYGNEGVGPVNIDDGGNYWPHPERKRVYIVCP